MKTITRIYVIAILKFWEFEKKQFRKNFIRIGWIMKKN